MNNTLLVHMQRCIVPLALIACSGSEPSELFLSPSNATTEPPSTSSPTTDAGGAPASAPDSGTEVDSAPPPPIQDSGAPLDAGAWALGEEDSGFQPIDAGPNTSVCPLANESVTTIDDGSWPAANASILPQCGRTGAWYVFNDGASDQSPNANGPFGPFLTSKPPSRSTGYVRTWGNLSEVSTGTPSSPHWGAGFGFDLDNTGTALPYDVSSYQGFSFWVRTGSSNQIPSTRFSVPTSETVSYADGAYHGFTFPAPAEGVWTEVNVPFTSLTQPSWTLPSEEVTFDQTAVLTLQWNFSSGGSEVLGFDVEIGEIEFF
jgi:hypothetical protein